MKIDLNNSDLNDYIFSAEFGLEKECLRVDKYGFLSQTPHPFPDNPNIQRDFCENQTEFVTDVFTSAEDVCRQLRELHRYAAVSLKDLPNGREFLWPFSNPPYVKGEDDVPVAIFDGDLIGKRMYRQYLAEKYGKRKMLYSGIHLNFSFSDTLLKKVHESESNLSYKEFKNGVYLKLAKKLVNYAWLIVYLTAASPVSDGSFFKDDAIGKDVLTGYSSSRCSEIGYWNDFVPVLSYDSLDSYVASINKYVENKQLKSASELYYPVRLKPRGENSLETLLEKGVNHIELRMFDDNPFSPIGIFEDDIKFAHLLILYLLSQDDFRFDSESQIRAIKNEKLAAHFDDSTKITFEGVELSLREQALSVIDDMEELFGDNDEAQNIIAYQKNKLANSGSRYAEKVAEKFGENYVKKGLQLAEEYADKLLREGG